MDLWYPPEDEAPLLEWWTPLLLAASAARRERVPWPIHLDDFTLMGRVDRGTRRAVWIYQHRAARKELYLDATGQPYKFTRTPNGKSHGRFTACRIRQAVFQADLPSFVEPVWYEEPAVTPMTPSSDPFHDREAGATVPPSHPTRRRPGARRGHLTLIQGGRQAG